LPSPLTLSSPPHATRPVVVVMGYRRTFLCGSARAFPLFPPPDDLYCIAVHPPRPFSRFLPKGFFLLLPVRDCDSFHQNGTLPFTRYSLCPQYSSAYVISSIGAPRWSGPLVFFFFCVFDQTKLRSAKLSPSS